MRACIDLRKAFDIVNHHILLTKLDHYGIRGLAKGWFYSYLRGRKQFVTIGNQASTVKEIVSGVPQGAALDPLLFLIYINDLHSCLKYSKTYHFADDILIALSECSQEILAKRLKLDLRKLSMWLRTNKLSLNAAETELVVFQRQNSKLKNSFKIKPDGKRLIPTTSVKYLCILLDKHSPWSTQISYVSMKLNRANGILSTLRYQENIHVLKTVYHSLFGTYHLLYVCQLRDQNSKETQNQF